MARVLVALGGNALQKSDSAGTADELRESVGRTAEGIAAMLEAGHQVVVTHGNGPQVGAILVQNESGHRRVPPMPLDVCGAQSQGQLGYLIQQSLQAALKPRMVEREVVTLVTQTLVDPGDPAFDHPSKPIGPPLSAAEAKRRI